MTKQSEALRAACEKLRRSPMPLANMIPLMQQAADKIDDLEAELLRLHAENDALKAERIKSDALHRQALEALKLGCPPDCKDGMTDSGGVYPWGEAVLIPCPSCSTITALREQLGETK